MVTDELHGKDICERLSGKGRRQHGYDRFWLVETGLSHMFGRNKKGTSKVLSLNPPGKQPLRQFACT